MHVERALYIIFALLGFIIILSFVPIELTIIYAREQGKDHLDLLLGFFNGVFRFRALSLRHPARLLVDRILQRFGLAGLSGQIPPGDTKGQRRPKAKGTLVTRVGWRAKSLILDFFKMELARDGLPCRDFEVSLNVGAGDAALTGMLVGGLWAATSPAIFSLGKFIKFGKRRPRISIKPDFSARRLDVRFRCILVLNVGYIILRSIVRRAGVLLKKGVQLYGSSPY
ncbi:MAG: DUF2953 domain-containing protein [Firmicutes bacterium]|nr:DUF2953 domain-containing protein [Bacillota bacterium]